MDSLILDMPSLRRLTLLGSPLCKQLHSTFPCSVIQVQMQHKMSTKGRCTQREGAPCK